MKNIIILVFLLCFINVVSFGQTQMEMNQQARTNYKKADVKMAIIYKKVQKVTLSDINKKLLLDVQRKWIIYKEAHFKSASASYEGGSIQPFIYYNCLTEITNERTKQLNIYLGIN